MLDYSHDWKNMSRKIKHLPVSVDTDDLVVFTIECESC